MSCALGEKLRPGTWDARLAGRWAGGAVHSQGARPRWARVWWGLCPQGWAEGDPGDRKSVV